MISIVTGTLNRKHLLLELIKNTVDSEDTLELVLVDGGSTDGTIEMIKNLNHPRIKLIEVGERSSYPHFMNLGIKNSSFEIICQWNDDVLLMSNWKEVFKQIDNEHDFYLFNWKIGSFQDYLTKNNFWLNGKNHKDGWWLCNTKNSIGGGEIVVNYGLYKKKIFREIGLYDNKFTYYYADSDMAERAWYFGYKGKNLYDIKVLCLDVDKKAFHETSDFQKWSENQHCYKKGEIPKTIQYLP